MNFFPLRPALLLLATILVAVVAGGNYDTIPGRSCFRSMSGMMESMDDLADEYPDLMTISDIGNSYLKENTGRTNGRYEIPEGGFDIFALKITSSSSSSNGKGKMLVTSGVHAREWAPPELLARFVELLVRGYGDDADATWILDHVEVHAILYVNPDGRWMAERYPELYWRKNLNPDGGCGDDEYGVDINRNFDFMWGERSGASHIACDSDYHGESAESEPETQALAKYARDLFPKGQRKDDPEGDMSVPFGEENTGMYIDIHSSGGYVYYPWGHRDAQSPDDEALQALGRKINSFNDYKLWAGGQPDFVYEASGDTSDYLYAVMGVASLGFEIGDDFYQDCSTFENEVVPINLPALVYAAKVTRNPFKEVKGPDILDLDADYDSDGGIHVTATASDSRMVNEIRGFPDFKTGDQLIEEVQVYLDVHPDDYRSGDDQVWSMQPTRRRLSDDREDSRRKPKRVRKPNAKCGDYTKKKPCKRSGPCEWLTTEKVCIEKGENEDDSSENGNSGSKPSGSKPSGSKPSGSKPSGSKPSGSKPSGSKPSGSKPSGAGNGDSLESTIGTFSNNSSSSGSAEFSSGEEAVELTFDASSLSPGRHTLFVQATDSDGYKGPVYSVFIEVSGRQRAHSLLRG